MDWWDDEFCERLAAGGRYVIRYDTRDTGRSTTFPPARRRTEAMPSSPTRSASSTRSASTAPTSSVSMGGAIAQQLAVFRPERVPALTFTATAGAGPPSPAAGRCRRARSWRTRR